MSRVRWRNLMLGGFVVGVIAVGFASLRQAPPPKETVEAPLELPVGRIRVEVLNGGDVRHMAREATALLRDAGLDVVEFGNAGTVDPQRLSVVIDRVGRAGAARAVADVLGIDNVRSEPDPNLFVDVSVLLGSEWLSPAARSDEADGEMGRAWWDPIGLLNR